MSNPQRTADCCTCGSSCSRERKILIPKGRRRLVVQFLLISSRCLSTGSPSARLSLSVCPRRLRRHARPSVWRWGCEAEPRKQVQVIYVLEVYRKPPYKYHLQNPRLLAVYGCWCLLHLSAAPLPAALRCPQGLAGWCWCLKCGVWASAQVHATRTATLPTHTSRTKTWTKDEGRSLDF
jgi:hypothetical protein